jgi:hypothetical protein
MYFSYSSNYRSFRYSIHVTVSHSPSQRPTALNTFTAELRVTHINETEKTALQMAYGYEWVVAIRLPSFTHSNPRSEIRSERQNCGFKCQFKWRVRNVRAELYKLTWSGITPNSSRCNYGNMRAATRIPKSTVIFSRIYLATFKYLWYQLNGSEIILQTRRRDNLVLKRFTSCIS